MEKTNVEHRTSNAQRRMEAKAPRAPLIRRSMFGVRCSMFILSSLLLVVSSRASEIDDWKDLQTFLPKIQGVCTTQPSNVVTGKYTSGQLLGNGEIGVVVGDTLTSQKFYFGKSNFLGLARNDRQNRWENSILPIGSLRISSS